MTGTGTDVGKTYVTALLVKKLKERGFTVIKTKGERVSLPELLKALAKLGISGILVEGGSETLTSFLKAKLADRITVFRGDRYPASTAVLTAFPSATVNT